MRFTPPASIAPAYNMEKEAKLIDFIAHHAGSECLLVARSPQSPVVKALSAMSDRMDGMMRIRTVFAYLESGHAVQDAAAVPVFSKSANCRVLEDPRLLDAHEQLVLDGDAIWLGDCMRRDPLKRDAFEQFSTLSPTAARNARISFERLWAAGEPVHEQLTAAVSSEAFPLPAESNPKFPQRPRA